MILKESLHICLSPEKYIEIGYSIKVVPERMNYMINADDIILLTKEFELSVPIPGEQDLLRLAIESFDKKIKDEMAKSHKKIVELESKRDALLRITHVEEV